MVDHVAEEDDVESQKKRLESCIRPSKTGKLEEISASYVDCVVLPAISCCFVQSPFYYFRPETAVQSTRHPSEENDLLQDTSTGPKDRPLKKQWPDDTI
jgi:hypothetical protein